MRVLVVWLAASAALAADDRFFDRRVAPILVKRCVACHNPQLDNGGLALDTRAGVLKGGRRGRVVVAGKPESSLLIEVLRHRGDLKMPPGKPLKAREVATLREWVRSVRKWD